MTYASAASVLREVAEIARPPRVLSVPESAEENIVLDIPGGYAGPWRNDLVHYLVEPAECLTKRDVDAVIFVGPAQSAKTQMLADNWAAHSIVCDPSDQMIVQPSELNARDYSKRRIRRLIESSPNLRTRLVPGHGDNVYDKVFRAGNLLNLAWPTKNTLSGKAIGKMALTDYDRMPEDVDGHGSPFQLAADRTRTFLSRGMTLAESSPSRPIIDPKWRPKTPHEAPPTTGILGLYNTGDRRRIYGKCPHCAEYFAPDAAIGAVQMPDDGTVETRSEAAQLVCTANGCMISQNHERTFRRSGVWLKEGQAINADGEIQGEGIRSRRATFWMPGWFAAFATWRSIVAAYLYALDTYERTGDEESLKTAVNSGIGGAYLPQNQDTRDGDYLSERTRDSTDRFFVPNGVRGLLATVDIQGNRFEIAVWGHGRENERWLVDRFALRKTPDGNLIRPAARIEHWECLVDRVINATYRLGDERNMRVHAVAVDSGGMDGVSERAYEWWRGLRSKGLSRRVRLIKGEGQTRSSPIVRKTYPDATKRKDRPHGGRGDVPVLAINTDRAKDSVHTDLQRDIPGPRYIHFPKWTPDYVFDEIAAEQRNDNGHWEQIARRCNETFDLLVYDRALWRYLKGDGVNWDHPPPWLREWDSNSEVLAKGQKIPANKPESRRSVSKPRPRTEALIR